jgi:DNA uptake protein ComE-like DNA-binding protein
MIKTGRVLQTITALALTLGVTSVTQAQVGNNSGVLNPNLASADEMAALPHMTAEIAKAIIEHRPHLTMLPLNEMLSQHLSDEQRAELYTQLFIPINLNTATEEEILLVPGVGSRMAHEFDEYRPYPALAQFRREMGKYVDDDQVAAYEQYVFVPIDLNSASDEDILSIPGVGDRMLREFKEYRPYRSIEQFRREMGKYVDDDEVARMERYVYIGG